MRGPANRSGRTRRVPPRLQDGPGSGTRNARHGLRSAVAGKPQLPQLNSIGFVTRQAASFGAGMWEPKKADASRWIRPWRIRTGQALASGSRRHFYNRGDRAAVAPIPKGHQARLYRREANTTLHDSSQPRTFSDNVPHSKRTQLRTRRKRITGWAFHPEGPRTSVGDQRSWPSA